MAEPGFTESLLLRNDGACGSLTEVYAVGVDGRQTGMIYTFNRAHATDVGFCRFFFRDREYRTFEEIKDRWQRRQRPFYDERDPTRYLSPSKFKPTGTPWQPMCTLPDKLTP